MAKAKKNTDITKRGKPVVIDEKQIEELASRFWTKTEIASFFGCSDKTISNKYSEIYTKGRESGKAKLRDAQLQSAIVKGNVTMQIWLGKQYLNQTDKIDNNNGLTDEQTDALRKLAVKEMSELL